MGNSRSKSSDRDADATARAVERLAALVRGGIPFERARGYLDIAPTGDDAAQVRASLRVAERAGSGMASALDAIAAAARERAGLQRTLRTAMAGPKATARLVMLLPLLGPLLAFAMGLDPLRALTAGPIGIIAVVIGAGLMVCAWCWSRAILRTASKTDARAGLQLELLAIAVRGGLALNSAREVVSAALSEQGLEGSDDPAATEIAELSRRAGVPVGGLLEAEARAQRHSAVQEAEARAARAGVTLTVPLGVCVLPAFVLLGVVPFVLATVHGLTVPIP
ncbi:MAG TPA: type II secretion system F family protein [Candidatus Agrococcus pullicola]|uniref:Type II secretion system F family protein n=1 Tax=Candidatus Agrococcus pullicola TaxID=2838429 RepID=A0A9D1YWF7_9MICO|nr:type II secretion system F family protein [Candidatus Agrococcus pullicola]